MSITDPNKEYLRLRQYLNPYIKGPNTDAILSALSTSSASLINNITAVNDQLYIATASGKYLEERLAEFGITKPSNVGISDDIFRQIGIQVKNRKQVRDLMNNLLEAMFGDELVRASNKSNAFEPYDFTQSGTISTGACSISQYSSEANCVTNGGIWTQETTLIVNFDDGQPSTITLSAKDFANFAAATAQEVADAITKKLRSLGQTGTAIAKNDGAGGYVEILSDTIGPASSVTVLGGQAQNQLKFDSVVAAGGNMSTQWTVSLQPGGTVRYTWTGGASPLLGKVVAGNYVNIFGGGFASSTNEGSYTITTSVGGTVGNSYFEVQNPLSQSGGIIVQGSDNAMLFYNATRKTVTSKYSYAAIYQAQAKTLQIFLPASTQVIRRSRIGSAHIHDQSDPISLLPNQQGPYIFDTAQPFTVSSIATSLSQNLDGTMSRLVTVADASQFPDTQGYLIIGYGSPDQEGPIPYISRPSNNTLLISPAYNIKKTHLSGADVALVAQKSPVVISKDGTDYPFYITDVSSGRIYAQALIQSVAAIGINIVFTILYPNSYGLGKWSTPYDEIAQIWD